ncbi:MAG TPA: DUF664 domain-containing protein [Acidimicrobiales bacterium]|nr:DUF664 domain-containing protein [Acidimicrobiales bacterium]
MQRRPPSPSDPIGSRTGVWLTYLDYLREEAIAVVESVTEDEASTSRVASGWTPLELLGHLRHVERRWIVWGFLGEAVDDPWGDQRDGRWVVEPGATRAQLARALRGQGEVTRAVVESHDLDDPARPGPRFLEGAPPPTLERILFHLLQEYARHVGHLDLVAEAWSTGASPRGADDQPRA